MCTNCNDSYSRKRYLSLSTALILIPTECVLRCELQHEQHEFTRLLAQKEDQLRRYVCYCSYLTARVYLNVSLGLQTIGSARLAQYKRDAHLHERSPNHVFSIASVH